MHHSYVTKKKKVDGGASCVVDLRKRSHRLAWIKSQSDRVGVLTAYKIKNKKWMAIWLAALVLGLWPDLWPIALGLGCRHDTGTTAAKCLAAVCLAATCWPPRQRLPLPLGYSPPLYVFRRQLTLLLKATKFFCLSCFSVKSIFSQQLGHQVSSRAGIIVCLLNLNFYYTIWLSNLKNFYVLRITKTMY